MKGIDRYWHLTWTTYGQWLPGDARGSVTRIRKPGEAHRVEEDEFGTPRTDANPELQNSARGSLVGNPIFLNREHADRLLPQFQETCSFRKWLLVAVAIMANHIHVLVGVPGDPDPQNLLRDLKSFGSRRLNQFFDKPPSGTWWTESGSRRKKGDLSAVTSAVEYIRDQDHAFVVWVNPVVETWGL
jgi:REP element-mobilizing transposase RayT